MAKAVFVRSPYNYDPDKVSEETGLKCLDKSLAKQEFAEESDINTIVKRFGLTGQLVPGVKVPQYADFDQVVDFQTAMEAVAVAKQDFLALPAKIRERFGNSPQALLEFLSDDANRPEAEKLGLVEKKPVQAPPEPQLVRVVQDEEAPPKKGGKKDQ